MKYHPLKSETYLWDSVISEVYRSKLYLTLLLLRNTNNRLEKVFKVIMACTSNDTL